MLCALLCALLFCICYSSFLHQMIYIFLASKLLLQVNMKQQDVSQNFSKTASYFFFSQKYIYFLPSFLTINYG